MLSRCARRFKEHCSWMGTASMHLMTAGVISLFASVGILLQCRLQLETMDTPLAGIPFCA